MTTLVIPPDVLVVDLTLALQTIGLELTPPDCYGNLHARHLPPVSPTHGKAKKTPKRKGEK